MRNPNPNCHGFRVLWRFLFMASVLILSLSVDGVVIDSGRNGGLEWQVLTKRDFSSQIRLNQHVLLMVTVPWSGESRALRKEVGHAAYRLEKLDHLRLMVVYRNTEKMLADALGAIEGTNIFFYYHSISYKYQGRLRAQNILSSVNHLMSLGPEELPLKSLNTPEDLKTFFKSTDKAVLLFEFCGWTPKLLAKRKTNGSEPALLLPDASDNGVIFGANINGETNQTLTSSGKKDQKGPKNEKLICGVENELGGIPLLGGFTSVNQSVPAETEYTRPGLQLSCSFEEFQKFESFFSKFTTFAREYFLPPEKQRFGLISEKSLLLSLGVGDPSSWLVMVHFTGCPNCSKILKDGDDLKTALQMHHPLVTELEGEDHYLVSDFPANKPSIILFVDRSSESSNTRRKSKAALDAFRKLAIHNQLSYQMDLQNSATHRKFSLKAFQGTGARRTSDGSDHPKKEFSSLTRLDEVKNKMSVMIINEGGNVALDDIPADAQGNSINNILAYLLRQKKEAKLSLLAKEAGFELLSGDFDVKIADMALQQPETSTSKVLSELHTENIVEGNVNLETDNFVNDASVTPVEPEDQTELNDFRPSQYVGKKVTYIVENTQLNPVAPVEISSAVDADQDTMETNSSELVDKLEVEGFQHQKFEGFYFFSDGGYQLLRSLTAKLKIPSVVIINPISEQHFIFPEEADFSYSSLLGFLDAFINGSLIPYQRSESVLASPREAIRPPFINWDFHEVDSIPRVTAHTFSELVLGYNQSDTRNVGHAWKKDVLVLFSSSWCGFCQRMEMVVREVFRAFKGYVSMMRGGSGNRESMFISDNIEDDTLNELPLIFLMDCTLNDCSSLLKSMGQRELYPALMLFPALRKSAVSYEGDMSVINVIKFIADHGSNSHLFSEYKGIFRTRGQKGGRDETPLKDASLPSIHEEDPIAKGKYHEVLLNDRTPTRAINFHQIGSRTLDDLHEAAFQVVVGSVLIATEKLLNAPPFDKSEILIVQADGRSGFQGLIINKHISWDSFKGLDKDLELVKKARLSFGGPLVAHEMPLVSLFRGITKEGHLQVFPSIYFFDQLATVQEIEGFKTVNQSTDDYWFFLGYSSWGWDQLFMEIAEGSWHISDDPMEQFVWPGS